MVTLHQENPTEKLTSSIVNVGRVEKKAKKGCRQSSQKSINADY
jgi:hypothetical protein